jgi:cytochrome c5
MRRATAPLAAAALAVAATVTSPHAGAQAPARSGEAVYQALCSVCHAEGKDTAPKTGDRKAWAPRIREGQVALTGTAAAGIRLMPARGGDPSLPLEEFARATVHLANASGAQWKDPDPAMLERIAAVEKRRVEQLRKKQR